jgi:predicted restriction endonuclease
MDKNKNRRQLIFEKYDGRCAYCGCELQKGWHEDHIEPIIRKALNLNTQHGHK